MIECWQPSRYRSVAIQLESVNISIAPFCGVNFQVAGLQYFHDKKLPQLPQHPFQLSSVSFLIYSNSLITQSGLRFNLRIMRDIPGAELTMG